MARPRLSLTARNVLVVLGCGALAVLAIGLSGWLSLQSLPGADSAPLGLSRVRSDFALSLSLISAFFLIVAGVVAVLAGRSVSGDVAFVARRIGAIAARGDLGEPVAIRTLDEAGALTREFERLRCAYLSQLAREREASRQAQEADRYKTEFLNSISHELRTPLNSILGFSQVLLAELEGPLTAGQREDLEMIQASGEHLQALFSNVIDMSELASGRIELHVEELEVEPILDEAARLLRGLREDKPVHIAVEVGEDVPRVHADPTRLRQILFNLASNALKFTQSGEVRFSAAVSHNLLVLKVSDTGVGIAPEAMRTIFDEFTQHGTDVTRRIGTGLGLSICRQLVELHGGQIWVDSQPGRGSTFNVGLPLQRLAEPL